MAPKVADRLSRLRMIALIGMIDRPELDEQHEERDEGDDPDGQRAAVEQRRPSCRRAGPTCPVTWTSNGASAVADRPDEVLALGRQRLHVGHDREVRAAAGVGGGEAEVATLAAGQHELAGLAAEVGQALAAVAAGDGVDPGHAVERGEGARRRRRSRRSGRPGRRCPRRRRIAAPASPERNSLAEHVVHLAARRRSRGARGRRGATG